MKLLAATLAVGLGGACTMDNPAFGETGEGTGSESAADVTDTQADSADEGAEVDTGVNDSGDGDAADSNTDSYTESGDGDDADVDTGDGDDADVDTGDGDTGEPVCEDLIIPIVADTFFTNGPQEGDPGICLLGWQWQAAPGEICSHLNFGTTGEMWLGVEGDGEQGESIYVARFNVDALPAPGTVSFVESASLNFGIIGLEAMPEGTYVQATLMTPGDAGHWVEGTHNGVEPGKGDNATTYKYQYYGQQAWGGNSPWPTIPYNLGEVDVSGLSGVDIAEIELNAPTVLSWFDPMATADLSNGVILSSNAPLFELLVPARENPEGQPTLEVHLSVCY